MKSTHPGLRAMSRSVVDADGCWLFQGQINNSGYGVLGWRPVVGGSRVTVLAHRATWEYFNGPIPAGLVMDHLCRVRVCCNPGHLEPVTMRENLHRGEHPKVKLHLAGKCAQGHDMTPENTMMPPSGGRKCRECFNRRQRERRLQKAGAP